MPTTSIPVANSFVASAKPAAKQQDHSSIDADSQNKIFRSVWLCGKKLTESLLPLMREISQKESLENNNPTNPFLPHITLCSGDALSLKDARNVASLFNEYFPKGVSFTVVDFKKNPEVNPPIQLIFNLHSSEDHSAFNNFQNVVKERLGIDVNMNANWLHATLVYKTVKQPLLPQSVALAEKSASELLGETVKLDEYAITTGRAWNPQDIAKWEHVKSAQLCTLSAYSKRTFSLKSLVEKVEASQSKKPK